MPFKNIFASASPTMASPSDKKVGLTSEKCAVQAIMVGDIKDLPTSVDVHVRMDFDENGNLVVRAVEHLRDNEASPTPSDDLTLVGTPSMLSDKPELVDAHTVTNSPATLMDPIAASSPPPSSPHLAASCPFEGEVVEESPSAVHTVTSDDFQLLSQLGEGGQGAVFLVQERATERLYALKVAEKNAHPAINEMMFREQEVLESIAGSPWFLSLKASFEDDQYFFLLTDLYDGGSLESRIRRSNGGKLADGTARRYCAQIILAMEDLHKRRIIHRDIKPANILLNSKDEVVIADFGFARAFGETVEDASCDALDGLGIQLDVTNEQCGTPQYMAPEIWKAEPYSYAVDVYSFGVMMYEMLNGKLPFNLDEISDDDRLTMEDIMEAVCMRRSGLEVEDDIDDDACDLLASILEQDPDRRPSWEQIKEHPWFDGVNWSTLSRRTPVPAVVPPTGSIPDDSNEEPPFGMPYQTGDEPHPFFKWTSPELQFQPATAPEASPLGSNPPPSRNNPEVATPPQEAPPPQKCTPLPLSHEAVDAPSASATRSTPHASPSVPLPGHQDQANAPAPTPFPSPLAPRQARDSSVVLVSDQRAPHPPMRAAPTSEWSAHVEEVASAPGDEHAAADADVDDVSASVARAQDDDSGYGPAPTGPSQAGMVGLGRGLGLGVVFAATTLAGDRYDVDVVRSWTQDLAASVLCDDAHTVPVDAPLSALSPQFPSTPVPGPGGDLWGNVCTSLDASGKSPVSFNCYASAAVVTTVAPSADLALGGGSAANASPDAGTSDLEVSALSAALAIPAASLLSGMCSRPLEVKDPDASLPSFTSSSSLSSALSDCSLGSAVWSYDGETTSTSDAAPPGTQFPSPDPKAAPNWLARIWRWLSHLGIKAAGPGGRRDLLV
ncbi:Serine/threonine-protein kinase AtPK1/AtPK6 [Trametes pubescens]|uniref:Serine/threonine-protein kinase AtPK1/AtPK6 n=1 Tax=Trametes pubescens TaxID=154538 RepID=A0A1M2VTR9_TRAPU|nr:Serine/threonine-protein kinase AtPK1/AtPK6 [Trametes pubescens]